MSREDLARAFLRDIGCDNLVDGCVSLIPLRAILNDALFSGAILAHVGELTDNIGAARWDIAIGLVELGADPLQEYEVSPGRMFNPLGESLGRNWELTKAMTMSPKFNAAYLERGQFTLFEIAVSYFYGMKKEHLEVPTAAFDVLRNIINNAPEFILNHRSGKAQNSPLEHVIKLFPEALSIVLDADTTGITINTPNPIDRKPPFVLCLEKCGVVSALKVAEHPLFNIDHYKDEGGSNAVVSLAIEAIDIPYIQKLLKTRPDLADPMKGGLPPFMLCIQKHNAIKISDPTKAQNFVDMAKVIAILSGVYTNTYVDQHGNNLVLLFACDTKDQEFLDALLTVAPDLTNSKIGGIPFFVFCLQNYQSLAAVIANAANFEQAQFNAVDDNDLNIPLQIFITDNSEVNHALHKLLQHNPDLANQKIEGVPVFISSVKKERLNVALELAKSPAFHNVEQYVDDNGQNIPLLLSVLANDKDLLKSLLDKAPVLANASLPQVAEGKLFDACVAKGHIDMAKLVFHSAAFDIQTHIDANGNNAVLKFALDSRDTQLLHEILDKEPALINQKIEGKNIIVYLEGVLHTTVDGTTQEEIKHLIAELLYHKAEMSEAAQIIAKSFGIDLVNIQSHAEEWHIDLVAKMMADTLAIS